MYEIATASCNLYEVERKHWLDTRVKNERQLSGFESWALKKAFDLIVKSEKGHNCWCWTGGVIEQQVYENNRLVSVYELGVSEFGVLVLWKRNGNREYTNKWIVEMI